ncbi:unnamed protein product [Citrullus colocynthis]|uniref:Uncharacterized protein n=1 Tax=Citrullus colocynthis TaxID=252529 RepID=A0ABP0Y243_9ROSI
MSSSVVDEELGSYRFVAGLGFHLSNVELLARGLDHHRLTLSHIVATLALCFVELCVVISEHCDTLLEYFNSSFLIYPFLYFLSSLHPHLPKRTMDPKLKNLQFLGVLGIIQETIKLIYQWRKIFTQITLAFILPSYILTFANMAISMFFLNETKPSRDTIIFSQSSIYYLIFNIVSTLFSAVFILLATATVVYTVACVYAAHDVSFKHVIGIVPKVWKRLLLTSLSAFISLFGLTFVALLVLFLILFSINGPSNGLSFGNYIITIAFIFIITIYVGTLYLTLIWQLSKIVAVLEELCGFKAMAKSKALVKGKMRIVFKLFIMLCFPIEVVQLVFSYLVIQSTIIGIVGKVVLIIIWMLLLSLFFLVTLVAQTVLYFICKSHHHEIVQNSCLSDHLQRYLLVDHDSLKDDEKLQMV